MVTLPEKYVVLREKYVAGLVTLPEKYVVLPEKYVAELVTLPEQYVVLSEKYVAGPVCQNNDQLRGALFWGMTMTDAK